MRNLRREKMVFSLALQTCDLDNIRQRFVYLAYTYNESHYAMKSWTLIIASIIEF